MWEAQSGSHTVGSHGVRVARTHLYDWLILMLLGLIIGCLNIIRPFHRFVGKDMMSDIKYPHKSSTVPFWAVPLYAVLLPIVVFLLFYLRQRDVYDLHHAILGLLFSAFVTAVTTDAIKAAIGRPRPDFFWRCFPDGIDVYDQWGGVVCHGDERVIRQGHKSFPSGHTSCLVVACFCYLQFFPPPYHVDGWRTHARLRVVEASCRNSNNVQCRNAGTEIQVSCRSSNNLQCHNAGIEIQQTQNNNLERGLSVSANSNISVDVESGTR